MDRGEGEQTGALAAPDEDLLVVELLEVGVDLAKPPGPRSVIQRLPRSLQGVEEVVVLDEPVPVLEPDPVELLVEPVDPPPVPVVPPPEPVPVPVDE